MAILFRFVCYGLIGWAVEIVWTAGKGAIFAPAGTSGRWALAGRTYLWMFPIYGSIAFFYEPMHEALRATAWPLRAVAYAAGILAVEYVSGWLLRRLTGACPWDYAARPRPARWQVHGLIRLDYAPAWALLGLALERVHDVLVRVGAVVLGAGAGA